MDNTNKCTSIKIHTFTQNAVMILRHVSILCVPQGAIHKNVVYKTQMNCQLNKTADGELTQDIHHYGNIKDELYKTSVLKIRIRLIIHPRFIYAYLM